MAGAYRPDGTRLAEVTLTPFQVNPPPPLSATPASAVPLGDSILFLGAEVQPARPLHPGETVTVRKGVYREVLVRSEASTSW